MSFRAAMSWLPYGADQYAGEPAVLRRGHREVPIRVVRGSSAPKLITEEERATLALDGLDFLIRPKYYQFDTSHNEPLPGDRILINGDNEILQFVVTPFQSGEPCWKWNDQYHENMRVFTKYEDKTCPAAE